jgi:hypothetical protein
LVNTRFATSNRRVKPSETGRRDVRSKGSNHLDSIGTGRHALEAAGGPEWTRPCVTLGLVSDEGDSASLRARGEEALGELAQALVDSPVFSGALSRALGAGERAASAQRQAMTALNLAAGSDIERLELRLRSLSARLEAVEDSLDELSDEVAAMRRRLDQDAG